MSLICEKHADAMVIYDSYKCATCPVCDLQSDLAIVKTNRDTLDDRCRVLEEELKELKDTIMEMSS